MKVLRTVKEMVEFRKSLKSPIAKVGFVPTMGSLHNGHITLIDQARKNCNVIVTSIFVNKTQFGPNEDFNSYPRDLDGDVKKILNSNKYNDRVEVVFAPESEDVYPPSSKITRVNVEGMDDTYEGRARPGHFSGVATVLSKLFNIVQPDISYFGQKDAIQSILVKRLVKELNFPIDIVIVPTEREKDGLAMSSRNVYLTPEQRNAAPILYKALKECERVFNNSNGNISSEELFKLGKSIIEQETIVKIDYFSLVDMNGTETQYLERDGILSGVIKCGNTRLLDNMILKKK